MKKNKIFVACDSPNTSKIKKIINYTKSSKLKIGYKFGLEFLNSKKGRNFVLSLKNYITFGDYKFNDIPNTCAAAVKAVQDLKFNYLRIHISSGLEALKAAKEVDWKTEYLDAKISIKTVKNVYEAVNHILKYGTMHTDSIITNNSKNAKIFLEGVNSSIAMHNVSTQFADGGEFGFGGEIGISTNKLPPRGPVGINQLTSYKYFVSGKGITRP